MPLNPEKLKINETMQDATSPEKKGEGAFGVEIVKSPVNADVVEIVQQLESAILHDIPLTVQQIQETEKKLDSMKVVIGGEEMTVAEMKKIPDLGTNAKIWEEIECGNYRNQRNITHITSHIAELILERQRGFIDLGGLISISDSIAENISRYEGNIALFGLTSISDSVADWLSRHQGVLYLNGLTSLSDTAAELLSKHKIGLDLSGLTSISAIIAEYLSRTQGELTLSGLTSISDSIAQHLSNHRGLLTLSGLDSLTDTVAENLSKHQGELYLTSLTHISDVAAQHLAQLKGQVIAPVDIEMKINSFKAPKT